MFGQRSCHALRTDYKGQMSGTIHEVFTRLFAESGEALRRYVRGFVRSRETADEIVQEAFLRTYERTSEQGDAMPASRPFLFSVARNLAIDRLRHERTVGIDLVGDFDDSAVANTSEAIENQLIADEASRLLKEAVEQLPPQCQAAFTLKVFHGHSYREIAEQLNLAEKTVEKHIARGLLKTHHYMRARYAAAREVEPVTASVLGKVKD
jgi:RNA polymerase sigma factor (sigma-70 family)